MSLRMRSTPNVFQKVRYSIKKEEDTVEWEKEKVYIYNYINDLMDDPQLEEEDIYYKVDLTKKIRNTKREQENTAEWEEREVNIYESAEEFTDNYIVSWPQEEDQQANRKPAVESSCARRAKLSNILPWILTSAAIIILTTYFILDNNKLKNGYDQQHVKLSDLETNNSQLQAKLLEMAANNRQLQDSYNLLNKKHEQLKDDINRLNYTIKGKLCPDGWTRFGCSCYFKSLQEKTWYESREYCQERGSDLVIINNEEEQEFVKNLIKKGKFWIGLQYNLIEPYNVWRWVDGSPVTKQFWGNGLPWNYYNYPATCCNTDGTWTQGLYNDKNKWICEK